MSAFVDETGNKYGSYTVIGRACLPRKRAHWKCRCVCGRIDIIAGNNLRSGSYNKACPHDKSYVPEQNIRDVPLDDLWRERYAKYGCSDCLEKDICDINAPCKYERILGKYQNYRAYLDKTGVDYD